MSLMRPVSETNRKFFFSIKAPGWGIHSQRRARCYLTGAARMLKTCYFWSRVPIFVRLPIREAIRAVLQKYYKHAAPELLLWEGLMQRIEAA
jgi:hypothetical protein